LFPISFNQNRPIGITAIGLYFLVYGSFLLLFRSYILLGQGDPATVIEKLNTSYFDFSITFLLPPFVMVLSSYGIWNRKTWGWWLTSLLMTTTILSFVFLFAELPFHKFLAYLTSQRNTLIISIVVLVYLFLPRIFQKYNHGKLDVLLVAVILVLIASFSGEFYADLVLGENARARLRN